MQPPPLITDNTTIAQIYDICVSYGKHICKDIPDVPEVMGTYVQEIEEDIANGQR